MLNLSSLNVYGDIVPMNGALAPVPGIGLSMSAPGPESARHSGRIGHLPLPYIDLHTCETGGRIHLPQRGG